MFIIILRFTSSYLISRKKSNKNYVIKNCRLSLNELGKDNKIQINWIPGHHGYEGNERADQLAKH